MSADLEKTLASQRRKRGATKASITRLHTKIREIEANTDAPDAHARASQISEKLKELGSTFKTQHFAILEIIENDKESEKEQEVLDRHDDEMTSLTIAVDQLLAMIVAATPACTVVDDATRGPFLRRLRHLKKKQEGITAKTQKMMGESSTDVACYLHYEQETGDLKQEITRLQNELMSLDIKETDTLNTSLISLEDLNSEVLRNLRKTIHDLSIKSTTDTTIPPDGKGVRLPKIDVPKFDGSILNWKTFWEQFVVSVDSQPSLSDVEKLVYLRSSLIDGSAKHTIEGLSRTGECYQEAIECLKLRYDRPRLIHQTHVQMIVEATPLKEGNGKELRHLHDIAQQHLRALKSMDLEPSGPFVTSILEMKLDANTMFEWQRYSQDSPKTPHYQKLLEFINTRAQASEALVNETVKKEKHLRKGDHSLRDLKKPVLSYTISTIEQVANNCVCCSEKHPLYICNKFKSLPHPEKMSILKSNDLCLNCLRPGHFLRDCKSIHRCRTCQKPHHSLLHNENKTNIVSSHTASGSDSNGVLLMTCRLLVRSPEGQTIEARGLLDCGSSASFISNRLAQMLKLRSRQYNTRISGVAGLSHPSSTQNMTTFSIAPIHRPNRHINLSAIVIPRVTCDLPVSPVHHDPSWSHLNDIKLADPQFGEPGKIDLLLGVDIFTSVIRQGQRFGTTRSPVAIETDFGWVLAGGGIHVLNNHQPIIHTVVTHHVVTTNCDDLLRRFWEVEEQSESNKQPISQEEKTVAKLFAEQHLRNKDGHFIVPLPRKQYTKPLGESRSKAVRRFISMEHSLHTNNCFGEFASVMNEYFDLDHAERVPEEALQKPPNKVFYYLCILSERRAVLLQS